MITDSGVMIVIENREFPKDCSTDLLMGHPVFFYRRGPEKQSEARGLYDHPEVKEEPNL
jgi:hypothetical protein